MPGCRTRNAEQHTQCHRLPHVAGLVAAHRGGKGGVALAVGKGGQAPKPGRGGPWPLEVDTNFENSHKILHTCFAQNAMRNRLGCRPYSERRWDPQPRAVTVIACGAARRRRPAAIPSGRGRLRRIRADSGGSPHTRYRADRLRQLKAVRPPQKAERVRSVRT